jgi:NAD(P)-dependent dehydrogenase (short-subunit alcohol dehydrogenase family)
MKKANGGVIINISSTAAFVGRPNRRQYQTSKYAVIGLTKSLAKDVGRFNIRVNSICLGAIEGERIAGVIAREASVRGQTIESVEKLYKSASSLGTFNTADDIADMILYLSGKSGEGISGHVMCVDSDML